MLHHLVYVLVPVNPTKTPEKHTKKLISKWLTSNGNNFDKKQQILVRLSVNKQINKSRKCDKDRRYIQKYRSLCWKVYACICLQVSVSPNSSRYAIKTCIMFSIDVKWCIHAKTILKNNISRKNFHLSKHCFEVIHVYTLIVQQLYGLRDYSIVQPGDA